MNLNLLGIDFEEWYHPQLVKPFVNHMKHEPKIIKGIERIIELLQKNETTATFFMVGELLEHKPDILDLILENGHEIAFHTCLLYTSPSPRDGLLSRMPSSA